MKLTIKQQVAAAAAEATAAEADVRRAFARFNRAIDAFEEALFREEQDMISRIENGAAVEMGDVIPRIVRRKVGGQWVKRLELRDAKTGRVLRTPGRISANLMKRTKGVLLRFPKSE